MTTLAGGDGSVRRFSPRRWLRFSLRTLLIAVTVFCLWLGRQVYVARRQAEAVTKIEGLGGFVAYDYEFDSAGNFVRNPTRAPQWLRSSIGEDHFRSVVIVTLDESQSLRNDHLEYLECLTAVRQLSLPPRGVLDDSGLQHVAGLGRLEHLHVAGMNAGNHGAPYLAALVNLKYLTLDETAITDDVLVQLDRLTSLEMLSLKCTRVTDKGLVHLRNLTQLKSLDLSNLRVADDGLVHLSALPALEELNLQATDVTDAGLVHLHSLPALKRLNLAITRVSERGLAEFERRHPKTRVVYLHSTVR